MFAPEVSHVNIHQANDVMEYPDEKIDEFISIRFSLKCFPTEVDISNNLYLEEKY